VGCVYGADSDALGTSMMGTVMQRVTTTAVSIGATALPPEHVLSLVLRFFSMRKVAHPPAKARPA
jgi:hypothetical protein